MDDIKRIYSLLVHSDGLKVREISNELALDKFYVAEVLFSPDNIPYWYQNDDSLWFAKEGVIQIEEPEKTDKLITPAEKSIKFNINKFLQGDISDSLWIYLNQIPRFRLYTNDELLELLNRYKAGDRNALELLVKSQQRFVANIAFIYRNRGASLEDIIQEGNIGLLRAIERFDDSQYRSFSNYAKAWIMQAISFSMTSLPFTLKLPANLLSLHRKVCRFKDKYEQINDIPPSVESIQIDESIANDRLAMIDGLPDNLSDLTIIYDDLDIFESTTSAIERFEDIEYSRYKAKVLLNSLSTRLKNILKSYYGIGCIPMSLEQIGIEQNLTRERVRQILVKTIRILRERDKKNDTLPIIENHGARRVDEKRNITGFFDPIGLLEGLGNIRENYAKSTLTYPSRTKEKPMSPEREAFLKEMAQLKPEDTKEETRQHTSDKVRKPNIRRPIREVIESNTFDLRTPLYILVQQGILTKKECQHCHNKRLTTIGDVNEMIRRYSLTPGSTRFTQYTLNIWFRIVRLLEKRSVKENTKVENGDYQRKKHVSYYEKVYNNCTKAILKLRQARVYGQISLAKPVLLLALIEGVEEGVFLRNHFVLNDWLEQRYKRLMLLYSQKSIFLNDNITEIDKPFWHLESDGFWHLNCSEAPPPKRKSPSKRWLKDKVSFAYFNDDLWILLQDESWRKKLHTFIVVNKL